jgi:hypothetical protein
MPLTLSTWVRVLGICLYECAGRWDSAICTHGACVADCAAVVCCAVVCCCWASQLKYSFRRSPLQYCIMCGGL